MKIKRDKLIELVNQRIAELTSRRQHVYENARRHYADERQRHVEKTSAAWRQFADTIVERIEKQQPVTLDDVPGDLGRRGIDWFYDKKPTLPSPSDSESSLCRLLQVLEATTDEEISTYSLEKMGFSLGRVLKA